MTAMKLILPVVFLLFSGAVRSQVNLNLGLRAYYPFSGNENDVSGNSNNPDFNSATLAADRLGNPNSAYHFNGVNQFMRIPNAPTLNTESTLSLCAWVRPTGFYAGPCHGNSIMMKGDGDYLPGNYFLRFDDGSSSGYTNCSNPLDSARETFYGYNIIATPPGYSPYIQNGQWYSVVVTYDGTTANLYVNCELKVSSPQNFIFFTSNYNLFFGRLNSGTFPYWFNGDLDEVRIYDRPLTQDEINVYGDCGVAPVKFTSFDVTIPGNQKVKLNWTTEAEANIRDYTIERGVGGAFVSIGRLPSKSAFSSNNYSFIDHSAKPNTLYYYRVVANDRDGSKEMSFIRTGKITNKEFYTSIYPNPTNGKLDIFFQNATGGAELKITNSLGQVQLSKQIYAVGQDAFTLDLSGLSEGIYWLTIQNAGRRTVKQIIKL